VSLRPRGHHLRRAVRHSRSSPHSTARPHVHPKNGAPPHAHTLWHTRSAGAAASADEDKRGLDASAPRAPLSRREPCHRCSRWG